MDKLGTYALVAALKGLTESSRQQRRRESDRWISLQASNLPQLDMTLDADSDAPLTHTCATEQESCCHCGDEVRAPELPAQPAALPLYERPMAHSSYIRQINERHDKALRKQRR